MPTLGAGVLALLLAGEATPPERMSIPTQDGGVVAADTYGKGERGVVLAHGGRFNKESWRERPGDKPRLPRIQAQYDLTPEPKELVILEGSAHAQFIFETAQGERLLREILRFLSAP